MFYPDEIAERLCKLGKMTNRRYEIAEAVYQLKAIAMNDLNQDYWRALYRMLNEIAERYDFKEILDTKE